MAKDLENAGIVKLLAKDILALMLRSSDIMNRYGLILDDSVFENPVHRLLFSIGRDFYEQFGRLPTSAEFKTELTLQLKSGAGRYIPDEFIWEEAENILSAEPQKDYVETKIDEFITRKALSDIAEKAKRLAESENPSLEVVRREIQAVLGLKGGGKDLGHFVLRNSDVRRRDIDVKDVIPTGIPELDSYLGGGREKGTLGIVMAGTGQGKSSVLITFGVNAVRARYKVAHITLELSEHATIRRYEAAFSNIAKVDIFNEEQRLVKRLTKIKRVITPGDVLVKEFPAKALGMEELRTYLSNVIFWQNFQPDLLIIDYADIMKLGGTTDDRWTRQGELYVELRGLAQEMNIAIWTAVQARKDALSKPKLKLDDIAGAIEKAQVADAIIALCRTEDERRERIGRFFIAKNRDNIDERVVTFRENFEVSRIESLRQDVATKPASSEDFEPSLSPVDTAINFDIFDE